MIRRLFRIRFRSVSPLAYFDIPALGYHHARFRAGKLIGPDRIISVERTGQSLRRQQLERHKNFVKHSV